MNHQIKSNTEQVILEAAEKLFLEKGFALTSTTEIAKHAGCNQALVHYYFRTKEKLFEAVFEKETRLVISPFLQYNDSDASFEEHLKQLIEAHFDILRKNPKVPFLIFNELLTNPARLESFGKKMAELPQSILLKLDTDLKSEIKEGTIRPIKTIDLIMTIVSLNMTMFLTAPILKAAYNMSDKDFNKVVENRKRENVLIILRSLKP